ncbi:MAG: hypothetical protein A2Y62_09920 [Candidatus Fischerbacteria bacterium RBG_13_37_8]|uniref:4-vinyl reductase 4VR domain-containing protein n=1 Tax=Candidatus Fischerbacteria bacterium RBG_13_37_8 TaxID=1817863 RepID=A0A1F5V7A5_9BACT|nr:MAG: hypothetical protein A2Y62_09920 [Candidatus Fischerbacteria bacterium RBG_13_37_8]
MQFVPFEKDIEVNGQTVYAIIDGMAAFKSIGKRFLLEAGIGEEVKGEYKIDPNGWYSHEMWLKAFERIAKEIGENTLYQIGIKIPKNAKFPPWVNNIENAIKSIDVAYHMNHRKNNVALFNQKTGEILEGIGHYGFEKVQGENMIISECNNPYPCSFDRGIITTMAKKFESTASILHDDSKPCRRKGKYSCTYTIRW